MNSDNQDNIYKSAQELLEELTKLDFYLKNFLGIKENVMNQELYNKIESVLIDILNDYIKEDKIVYRKEIKMVFDYFIRMNFTPSEEDEDSYYLNPYNPYGEKNKRTTFNFNVDRENNDYDYDWLINSSKDDNNFGCTVFEEVNE